MKKRWIYILLVGLAFQSCKNDDDDSTLTITEQNTYDDKAIIQFMDTHYFDELGNVITFNDNDESDDNEAKLSSYNPVTLPSGVVYILRPNAQPNPGQTIGDTDIIKIMGVGYSYLAKNNNGTIEFGSQGAFMNTISSGGSPFEDPFFYYAQEDDLTKNKVERSYYEIEGFQEGIQHFKSCEISNEENYNLQGIILVPSRAAYARDANLFNSSSFNFHDRSFMFNIQVYKTTARN